ncbi:MAG: DUF3592 domain-containing protein [Verrucomicrobiales bacterium]|nr:DUF3592 domain-containing protein [Verrucomicrobiales bacterium]
MNRTQSLQQNRGCFAAGSWILIAASVFFFSALMWNQGRLVAWGRTTDGTITKVTTRTTYGGSSSRRPGESLENYRKRNTASTSYDLHVRYTPEGAEPVEFKTTSTFGHELKEGDSVKVIYLPGSPKRAEIYSAKQLWWPMVVGGIVTLVSLVGGLLLRRLVKRIAAT